VNNSLGACKSCSEGVLMLDAASGLKITATCDSCDNHYTLIKQLQGTIKRLNKVCDTCGIHILKVIINKRKRDKWENNFILLFFNVL
jgi:ribosomal protein S27AE